MCDILLIGDFSTLPKSIFTGQNVVEITERGDIVFPESGFDIIIINGNTKNKRVINKIKNGFDLSSSRVILYGTKSVADVDVDDVVPKNKNANKLLKNLINTVNLGIFTGNILMKLDTVQHHLETACNLLSSHLPRL